MAKKGTVKVGKFSLEDIIKSDRKSMRDEMLESGYTWTSTHKIHKGKKDQQNYRKRKHKGILEYNQMDSIINKVNNFKTKYEDGFTSSEIDLLLNDYPSVTLDKFNSYLGCVTCIIIDDEVILYHDDVINALICCIENRNMTSFEWD